MSEVATGVPWVLALGAALALVALGAWLAAAWAGAKARARQRVAKRGEVHAEAILEALGYRIEGRQVQGRWELEVNGERVVVGLRADLVVTRRGRRFVAEVKTGDVAPDPRHPPTRRQLLEYSLAFGASQVLLVDVPAREVHTVRFPGTLLELPG